MDNTCSRKMLNRNRFRPHLINSRVISSSPQPVLNHLERKSQLLGLKVKFINSSASPHQSQNASGETKGSVMSRLELADGDTERLPDNQLFIRYVDEGYITLSPANFSPIPRSGQGELLADECYPESPAEPPRPQEEVKCEQRFSFAEDDVCAAQGGLPSQDLNAAGVCLEEDVEGAWDIGHPIFESSACHSFVNLDAVPEKSGLQSQGVQKHVTELSQRSLPTDSVLSTSWESTILPPVQVKSKVIIPGRVPSPLAVELSQGSLATEGVLGTSWESTILPPVQVKSKVVIPGRVSSPLAGEGRNLRSVTFNEPYWKHKKDQYVNLVSRHFMLENPKTGYDAMSDLVSLMSHVTKQSAGSRSDGWKHPSDFTRRNYQARFGNDEATTTLQEWQDKNGRTFKRFSNFPKIFRRSPCL